MFFPELELEFKTKRDKKYKVEAIQDSIVEANIPKDKLPRLYYLVSWKNYLETENLWLPTSAIIYLWNIINAFYINYLEKSMVTLPLIDSVSSIIKPTRPFK